MFSLSGSRFGECKWQEVPLIQRNSSSSYKKKVLGLLDTSSALHQNGVCFLALTLDLKEFISERVREAAGTLEPSSEGHVLQPGAPRTWPGALAALKGRRWSVPESWQEWGAGSEGSVSSVSHLYGFGLVDAEALVMEAKKWTAVPSQHTCVAVTDKRPR